MVLICYGDQVKNGDQPTLQVMSQFLRSLGLEALINTVHLLPINPYTSDDGFSVVDYRAIDQPLGTWDDVDALNEHFDLMLDLVLNHCSQHSDWFKGFLDRKAPYTDYFIEASLDDDLSQVVRPRSLPLLSEKQTADGPRMVWTTFSEDQVDLNFESTDVLIEILDILLLYAKHWGSHRATGCHCLSMETDRNNVHSFARNARSSQTHAIGVGICSSPYIDHD